jgi:cytoskeletal protein RodZ
MPMEFSLNRALRVFDSKRHAEPILLPADAACSVEALPRPLGELFADARERRGLTPEQAARDARVMVSYLRMIECGDYSAIPDMLYLLPFFQRYAAFLGLDVKEVTSRFVRDFEAAENAAAAPAAPVKPGLVVAMRSLPWPRIAQAAAIASVAILLAGLAFAITRGASQRTVEVSPNALTSLPPPVRVKTVPTPAESPSPAVAQASEAAAAVAAVAPKAAASPRRHSTHGASAHHHRHRHG